MAFRGFLWKSKIDSERFDICFRQVNDIVTYLCVKKRMISLAGVVIEVK